MVIFGAGASCDSSPAYPLANVGVRQSRPPLASELFDMRFGEVIAHFPRGKAVFTHLLPKVSDVVNVESVLEGLQVKALLGDEERYRQLTAVQFYLQAMLTQCTWNWAATTRGVTNYATLMDQIRELHEPVCLVTFNYDTLLEEALSLPTFGVPFTNLLDYISSDYKVIKVHGSVDWGHEVQTPITVRGRNQLQVASDIIDRRPKLVVDGSFQKVFASRDDIVSGYPIAKLGDKPMLPALAVPVENKIGDELPVEHRRVLDECLPKVTRILVIGWSANDNRFLKIFADGLARGNAHPSFMIVSRSQDSIGKTSDRIIARLKESGVSGYGFSGATNGFTGAIRELNIQRFLTYPQSTAPAS